MKWLKQFFYIIYKAGDNAVEHDGLELSGYLAFLMLLGIVPFIVLLVALAGFLGDSQTGADFIAFLFGNLPPHVVDALEPRIAEIISGPPQGLLTVAILSSIWTASSAVEGYRTVLNRAYGVHSPPAYILRRLLSIAQLVIFTFLLLLGMLALVLIPIAMERIELATGLPLSTAVSLPWERWLFWIVAIVLWLLVGTMYYVLPNIRQRFLSTLPGAAITVAGWMGSAALFSQYLSEFNRINLIYGSLGGIIATLIFFYIVGVIFIYGAEFNYLLKRKTGETIVEKEAADGYTHELDLHD